LNGKIAQKFRYRVNGQFQNGPIQIVESNPFVWTTSTLPNQPILPNPLSQRAILGTNDQSHCRELILCDFRIGDFNAEQAFHGCAANDSETKLVRRRLSIGKTSPRYDPNSPVPH
jgi:hypothetical protein